MTKESRRRTELCLVLIVFDRLLKLKKTFETKFGVSPQFYAFAPGRVNLIGNLFYIRPHVLLESKPIWVKLGKRQLCFHKRSQLWGNVEATFIPESFHVSVFSCSFFTFNRRAHWLLRLFRSADGHWTKHPCRGLREQLGNNHTGQHEPSVQVRTGGW